MNPDLKYKVIIYNDWQLAQDWCEQTVGVFDQDWYKLGIDITMQLFDERIESVWYFRSDKDAAMFALKWL